MKKSTKIISAVLASLMLVAAGCSSDKPAEKKAGGPEEKVLTVYSARSEQLNNAVIPQFEKDTGIKVNLVVAGTGEVLKRAKSEKDNPLGDILWAADETMLSSSKDLFMEYTSTENDKMMDGFKNKAGVFTPAFADPTVMIVNTELANGMKIDGFEDLLNPALKGKIAFGDPVNSSSAFQSLMAMLYGMGKNGDPMSPEAWDYVDKFIANLGGKMCNSSSQVYKGVAGGEYVVGLTWEDPAANLVKNGAKVKVVFPVEGAIFPGESVRFVQNEDNTSYGCGRDECTEEFPSLLFARSRAYPVTYFQVGNESTGHRERRTDHTSNNQCGNHSACPFKSDRHKDNRR